jgi:hypothetical protein
LKKNLEKLQQQKILQILKTKSNLTTTTAAITKTSMTIKVTIINNILKL